VAAQNDIVPLLIALQNAMRLGDPRATAAGKAFAGLNLAAFGPRLAKLLGIKLPASVNTGAGVLGGLGNIAGGAYNLATGDTRGKIGGGFQLASGVAQGADLASKLGYGGAATQTLGQAGGWLGPAAAAANIGLIATDPNLSTKQKAGHSADTAVAAAVWPYGLTRLANANFSAMQRSGSPTIRNTGKALAAPTIPFEALLNVLRGNASPRAAGNAGIAALKDVPGIGHTLGSVLGAVGLGTTPTTGTQFRRSLQQLFQRIPELGAVRDFSRYNAPTGSFTLEATEAASALATLLAPNAGFHGRNPDAYTNQAANIILANLGEGVVPVAAKLLAGTGGGPAPAIPAALARALGRTRLGGSR
jgi:hypothetical protein